MAFKNMYDEKTINGWHEGATPGMQWRVEEFGQCYKKRGKQIFYDALIFMLRFIGKGTTVEEKVSIAGLGETDKEQELIANQLRVRNRTDPLGRFRGHPSKINNLRLFD